MTKQVIDLSYHGKWAELLVLLRRHPCLVNVASEPKGYTPLHQAAWHGASLAVVGELLTIGADRGLKTHIKLQTAQDIALESHADREDLAYILAPGRRTLAQLMRKVVADTPDLFTAYDGNQIVCDRLIASFGSDPCPKTEEEVDATVGAAFRAVTGADLSSPHAIEVGPHGFFRLTANTSFWRDRFLWVLRAYTSRAHIIPIEKEWAVVSDLFNPGPDRWGLRGDLFLWVEMRQALCHVEIPAPSEGVEQTISSAFTALTGMPAAADVDFYVKRLARGGMSSGAVCGRFWCEELIPLLRRRSAWLQETWRR